MRVSETEKGCGKEHSFPQHGGRPTFCQLANGQINDLQR